MQYAQLIELTQLETVIELSDANQVDKAKQLVSTYILSQEMAERLIKVVFVQLQFEQPTDSKGLLIVGHYGTGKSHLMAVISSIAENAEFIAYLTHPQVANTASAIAGKFKVLRTEIGATTMSLRDLLLKELAGYLNNQGIPYQFPATHTITNNKRVLADMMATFATYYPKQGLLLVVDELLDYLRTRKDQELILDLSFLRELGEICKNSRFRFIAGLQETIFDNPRFEFVAHSLRRVKDRFEQILITRQDIKFVISERLLKKNQPQQRQIQDYLTKFTRCYDNMNERIAEFVSFFPVHPDYIDTFERLTIIEKREILKTLEQEILALADTEVPTSYPGLLAYDSYWNRLCHNPSFRTLPDVREIIECSQVLTNRIEQAFRRPAYLAMARRIIDGLSVHRLTTHDIHTPIGITARELRDSLCLYQAGIEELGSDPADNLLSLVETVLQEILQTVNRQFISINPANGQYYIDFKKNYDFAALIEKRADTLDNHQLDRYYYAALRQIMEVSDQATGWTQSFCWAYELEWRSHKVTRPGYLVFGSPKTTTHFASDERFVLYFLPLYPLPELNESFSIIGSKSEVFFRLTKTEPQFEQNLRYYAAAHDLAATSVGHAKAVYESKAQSYLREVLQWLQVHKPTAFTASHQADTQTLLDWIQSITSDDFRTQNHPFLFKPHPSLLANFRDLIDLVADICLDNYFTEIAPQYPFFPIFISQENLPLLTQEAIRNLANPSRSKPAQSILTALCLLDGNQLAPSHSKYAQAIREQLYQKPLGQVLNRTELFSNNYFAPSTYRLEPELVMMLIAALVYSGELVLVMPNQIWDATQFAALAATPINQLLEFKYLERPRDFNLPALTALFELLALPSDLAIALTQHQEQVVQQLHHKVNEYLEQLIPIQQRLTTHFNFWGKPLFSDHEIQHYQERLANTKNFLDSLSIYSSAIKFKNFRYSTTEIAAQREGCSLLQTLIDLQKTLTNFNQATAYLTAAQATLPPQYSLVGEINQTRNTLFASLKATLTEPKSSALLHQPLKVLKQTYIQTYLQLHQQARLGPAEELIQQNILTDPRFLNLKILTQITLLPHQQLTAFEHRLTQLPICFALTEADLLGTAICPHCGYQPIAESPLIPAKTILTQLSQTLEQLYTDWNHILLTELENTKFQHDLLKPEHRTQIEPFLLIRTLPQEITPEFIQAVQEGLADLIKINITVADLNKVLLADSSPITLTEIQERFNNYLQSLIQGQEVDKIRILLE